MIFLNLTKHPKTIAAGLDVIENEPELRSSLWSNIRYFKENLLDLGFNIGNSETAIFPIIIGDDIMVKEACKELHDIGIYVNPVLYPAVKKDQSRIRISLTADHTKEHLDKTLNALEDVLIKPKQNAELIKQKCAV